MGSSFRKEPSKAATIVAVKIITATNFINSIFVVYNHAGTKNQAFAITAITLWLISVVFIGLSYWAAPNDHQAKGDTKGEGDQEDKEKKVPEKERTFLVNDINTRKGGHKGDKDDENYSRSNLLLLIAMIANLLVVCFDGAASKFGTAAINP